MLLGFGYLCFLCFISFFFKKQKPIDFKKAVWPKFCNIIFLFLVFAKSRVGQARRPTN